MRSSNRWSWTGDAATWSLGWWLLAVAGLLLLALWVGIETGAAQAQNGISSPREGDTMAGIVLVEGTATDPAFLRYEVAFNRGGDWIVFADGSRQVQQGTLAVWDTTIGYPGAPVFPDGVYQLRLRVVRQDYNYDEYFVRNIVLANESATPTATATEAAGAPPAAVGTATPASDAPVEGGAPAPLPSLTPFPTPTVPPTAVSVLAGGPAATQESGSGLAQRLEAIDTNQFSRAFWRGARVALYAFAALAAYLLLRAVLRRLWRYVWARVGDSGDRRFW